MKTMDNGARVDEAPAHGDDTTSATPSVPHHSTIVIGGGQAGLSMSYLLKRRSIDHVVLERSKLAEAWRSDRWDTFCLVTPNWQCRLPGFPYAGDDPYGFMKKDEIVRYIESYADSFSPPLREGVDVTRLGLASDGRTFEIATTQGDLTADHVVVAVGGYHRATLPRMAERLPRTIAQMHSSQYKNAESLPEGDVLVVGTGQSGAQIAEDLHLAGRRVHLCVGSAPRTARRYRGKDVVEWLDVLGYYSMPVHEHPLRERVRGKANHYVTGRDGGRDIDLRRFAREGMQLYGRLLDVDENGTLQFGDDLRKNLDGADTVAESIKTTIDRFITEHAIDAPDEERYVPVWEPGDPIRERTLDGIGSVVWCMGFASDYRWIDIPIFDGRGYPSHKRGVTTCPGLYFLGLPWLYTWGSARFSGVADDATFLASVIGDRHATAARRNPKVLNELALGS